MLGLFLLLIWLAIAVVVGIIVLAVLVIGALLGLFILAIPLAIVAVVVIIGLLVIA